ncbi:hypothetical protein [Terrisporobacter sp.]|uniref:hypothetical protein n=1 Tax=Terrisporobacter sp. TaxID=1965305 RepID=UPI002A833BF1|nr:hypothetical protein [Terrisporobacter sp.]MDY4734867.1 hypothetical protein [Terrisporobacter sp.]
MKEKIHNSILNDYSGEKINSSFEILYNKINEFLDKIDDDTDSIEDLLIEGTKLLEEYRPLSGLVLND